VKKKGLKKAAEEEGISPSTSSKPSYSHLTSNMPTQSLYSIKIVDVEEECMDTIRKRSLNQHRINNFLLVLTDLEKQLRNQEICVI